MSTLDAPEDSTQRVAGYVRVSTSEQAERGLSLAAQEEAIREREPDARIYSDVLSGAKVDRPEYQRLLADAAAGELDRLLIWKFDRLGRDAEELLRARRMLEAAGVRIESLTEGDGDSTLLYGLHAIIGQVEREKIGERTRMGLRAVAAQGRWPGGEPNYGYALSDGERGTRKLVVDESEAPVVRYAFRLYAEGVGMNRVTATLNREGYRTRRGAKFSPRVIVDWLSNETYIGNLVRKEETLSVGKHEAIIDADTWEAVQRLRRAKQAQPNGGKGRPPKRHIAYPLLQCPNGHTMLARVNANGWQHYRCSNRHSGGDCPMPAIGRKKLDEELLRHFLDLNFDAEATRRQLRRAGLAAAEEADALVADAERQALGARAALQKLDAEFAQLPAEDFLRLERRFTEELVAAEAQGDHARQRARLSRLEAERLDADAELVDLVARAREAARGAVERATEADAAAVRAALQQLFVRIVVKPLWLDREWPGYDESDVPDGAVMTITRGPKQLMLIPAPREEVLLESGLTERVPLDLVKSSDASVSGAGSPRPS